MAFTLYSLLEAALLCLNAVCILHEERFLAKNAPPTETKQIYFLYKSSSRVRSSTISPENLFMKIGWSTVDQRGFGEEPGMKAQIINLIRSIRTVMRIPLIGLNVFTIVIMLLFG